MKKSMQTLLIVLIWVAFYNLDNLFTRLEWRVKCLFKCDDKFSKRTISTV